MSGISSSRSTHSFVRLSGTHVPKPIVESDEHLQTRDRISFLGSLRRGFDKFRAGYFADHAALFTWLSEHGQQPRAMLISCCDSRADPGIMFATPPGEMFTLRNVANLVPPYEPHSSVTSNHGTFASVEFAVNFLKVRHIVVLGHRLCGGVKALLENAWEAPENVNTDDHLACWMSTAVRAKQRALAAMGECDFKALWNRAELETVRLSVENLGTFPCVKEAVAKGKLQLHGLHFDFSNGHAVLKVWNSESGEFEDIDEMEELWGDDEHVITS